MNELVTTHKAKYTLKEHADTTMSHCLGYITVAPHTLVELFGQPFECGDKISARYVFETNEGNVITLYEWKSTSAYASDLPSPEAFWASTEPYEFHVGGHNKIVAMDFIDDLQALLTSITKPLTIGA